MKPILITTLLAVVVAASSSNAAEERPAAPPATVSIATAQQAALAPSRWVPGTVVSRDDARIASSGAGRVVEIAEVGTVVAKGARLAKLEDVSLRLRLDEVRAEAGRSKAQRDLANTQLARLTKLASGNAVAQTQLDEARATLETAAQDVARTEARRRSIEHDLAQTEIHAPFAGVVTERFVQRGEYLQVGASVAHLVDIDRLEARVQAPLALAPQVRAGQDVQVRLRGATQPVSVRTVVPVGDEKSRQFELRVSLPEGFALVGTAVEVALPENDGIAALTVPRDALVLRDSHTYVMRVKADNTAEQIEVKAGAARDALVEVTGDLVAGDRVIVRGAERLTAGQAVKIVEPT